jgi:hypothetical protein
MEYTKIGSKNNVYDITYDVDNEHYKCSCPDFKYRCSKKNEMCKHISEIKTMDDNNVNLLEYTKNGITKKILTPVELADKRINDDTDSVSNINLTVNFKINFPTGIRHRKFKIHRRHTMTIAQQLNVPMIE